MQKERMELTRTVLDYATKMFSKNKRTYAENVSNQVFYKLKKEKQNQSKSYVITPHMPYTPFFSRKAKNKKVTRIFLKINYFS